MLHLPIICVVLDNMLRTHQTGTDRAPTPANYVGALRNGQVLYVPDDNRRNSLREIKHLPDLLEDYFNHERAAQEDRT